MATLAAQSPDAATTPRQPPGAAAAGADIGEAGPSGHETTGGGGNGHAAPSGRRADAERQRIIVVSGLAGSGKTTVIKALEDIGYFCVDNLPVPLVETFLLLCADSPSIQNVGIVMDLREPNFTQTFRDAFDRVRTLGFALDVLFVDCSDDALINRFAETRRRHPFSARLTLIENIREERRLLADLREHATLVVDTTDLNVHQLKRVVQTFAAGAEQRTSITMFSFGFRHGLPHEAHYVFDVRHLPNPHFIPALRDLTGKDRAVRRHLGAQPETRALLGRILRFLSYVVPRHEREGKPGLTVAIGCTGGHHRSVYIAERVAARLRRRSHPVQVVHRDIDR